MKTLTTITAAVALIAGMSIANAQGAPSMGKERSTGSNTMTRVIGKSRYCVQTKSGTLNCKFASLSACHSVAQGAGCVTNPNIGTTGSGTMNR